MTLIKRYMLGSGPSFALGICLEASDGSGAPKNKTLFNISALFVYLKNSVLGAHNSNVPRAPNRSTVLERCYDGYENYVISSTADKIENYNAKDFRIEIKNS